MSNTREIPAEKLHSGPQDKAHLLPLDDDALVDEYVIAEVSDQSVSKLRNDRYLKQGIPYVKLGALARYRVGTYRKHIKRQEVATESPKAA